MLTHIEHIIFRFFNDTCHNAVLDKIMPYLTEIGGGAVIFTAAVVLLFFRKENKSMCGILLMAGLTASYHATQLIKNAIARNRPFLVLPDVQVLIEAKGFSFPSNHASMAFMAAFILTYYFKRWYIFYSLAVIVALSRVYLGVHYTTDIFAGALLGSLIGFILTRVAGARD